MALKKAFIARYADPVSFDEDLLGKSLSLQFPWGGAAAVQRIAEAHHSGKQAYRGFMKYLDEEMNRYGDLSPAIRSARNDVLAKQVTRAVYIPVALALSERFGKEVGYLLAA